MSGMMMHNNFQAAAMAWLSYTNQHSIFIRYLMNDAKQNKTERGKLAPNS